LGQGSGVYLYGCIGAALIAKNKVFFYNFNVNFYFLNKAAFIQKSNFFIKLGLCVGFNSVPPIKGLSRDLSFYFYVAAHGLARVLNFFKFYFYGFSHVGGIIWFVFQPRNKLWTFLSLRTSMVEIYNLYTADYGTKVTFTLKISALVHGSFYVVGLCNHSLPI